MQKGLATAADIQSSQAKADSDSVDSNESAIDTSNKRGYPHSLKKDIALYRLQINRACLLNHPLYAQDLLTFNLCRELFLESWYLRSLEISTSPNKLKPKLNDLDTTIAGKQLTAAYVLLDLKFLSEESHTESFCAFRSLDETMKSQIITYVIVRLLSLPPGFDSAQLKQDLSVNYAHYWRPTTDNFLAG